MSFTKKELVQFLDGLMELVSEERKDEALLIQEKMIGDFEKSYGFKKEEEVVVTGLPPYYVAAMPDSIQEEIRQEVIAGLKETGQYTQENIEMAMCSKIYDLEELIDIHKYLRHVEDTRNSSKVTDHEKSR